MFIILSSLLLIWLFIVAKQIFYGIPMQNMEKCTEEITGTCCERKRVEAASDESKATMVGVYKYCFEDEIYTGTSMHTTVFKNNSYNEFQEYNSLPKEKEKVSILIDPKCPTRLIERCNIRSYKEKMNKIRILSYVVLIITLIVNFISSYTF